MTSKTVLCFSGGLDSTVLLYLLRNQKKDVKCLSVYYGQRHNQELVGAQRIASLVKSEYQEIDFDYSQVRKIFSGSSQTDDTVSVPEGHYAEESMKATVVPNRNMILLSLATAWAVSLKADSVAYACHAGDHPIYYDCRQEFTMIMRTAIGMCDWHKVDLDTPFVGLTKADIVKLGHDLKVPFELTYSCYKGGAKHCGKCGTDVERKEAFRVAKVADPTEYEDETGVYRG